MQQVILLCYPKTEKLKPFLLVFGYSCIYRKEMIRFEIYTNHRDGFKTMNGEDYRTLNKRNLKKIYRDIREGKAISLDHSVLTGFSLAEYREFYGLSSTECVTVKLKSAIGALFRPVEGSAVCADFSWAVFEPEDPVCGIAFDESRFEGGIVDFSYIAADSDLSFDGCAFEDTTVKFIGCKFGCQDLSFYGADLGKSSFYFHVSEFKKDDFVFAYSKNLAGRVQIASCLFEQRNFEFHDMDNPQADFILADFDLSDCRVCFTNSAVDSILCYRVTFSARTDFDIITAEYITIQDSIIHCQRNPAPRTDSLAEKPPLPDQREEQTGRRFPHE